MSKIKQKFDLILASGSKSRRRILENLGLEFKIIVPDFDEERAKEKIGHLDIPARALFLAQGKARSVSQLHKNSLVIGSDQICQLGSATISKPKNKNEALEQLSKMSGKIHYQNNAVALFKNGEEIFSYNETATIKMRSLTAEEIAAYVELDNPVGCAGSYKIESLGRHLFENIKGDYACIYGLAIQPLLNYFYQHQLIQL